MRSLHDIRACSTPQARALISHHQDSDPRELALRTGPPVLPAHLLAQQVACLRTARDKLPAAVACQWTLETRALMQATCEAVARFRASLYSGRAVLDLTGGLGSDALMLSRSFAQLWYVDTNPLLALLFASNAARAGILHPKICAAEAAAFCAMVPNGFFDLIVCDPDRRPHLKRRVGLSACVPDVTRLIPLFLQKARAYCIKASPALETSGLAGRLPGLTTIRAISYNGECRETCLQGRRQAPGPVTTLATGVRADGTPAWEYAADSRAVVPLGSFESLLCADNWLYEPDPAIIKAGAVSVCAARWGLTPPGQPGVFCVGTDFHREFPGRVLRIVHAAPYHRKSVREYLCSRSLVRASVIRRDFPAPVEKLRALFGLQEGTRDFLIFTRLGNRKWWVHAVREK